VLEWGSLGERWGVNRSVSQIHALLYASKQPLAAEEIAEVLELRVPTYPTPARTAVGNIIRSVPILGDRRTFYTAETDLWNLVTESRRAQSPRARPRNGSATRMRRNVTG